MSAVATLTPAPALEVHPQTCEYRVLKYQRRRMRRTMMRRVEMRMKTTRTKRMTKTPKP